MKKVSIIIPVYNAEKYIKRTLNSIISQDYKNIEIIIVNDGSIDKSEKIINEIILENKKMDIKYFKNTNHGPSYSRNFGIERSSRRLYSFCR